MPFDITTQGGAQSFIKETLDTNRGAASDSKLLFSAETGKLNEGGKLNHLEVWSNLEKVTTEKDSSDRANFRALLETAYPEHAEAMIAHVEASDEAQADPDGATMGMLREACGQLNQLELKGRLAEHFSPEAVEGLVAGGCSEAELELLIAHANDEYVGDAGDTGGGTVRDEVNLFAPYLGKNSTMGKSAQGQFSAFLAKLATDNESTEVLDAQIDSLKANLAARRNPDTPPFTESPKFRGSSAAGVLMQGMEVPESAGEGPADGFGNVISAFDASTYSAIGANKNTVGLRGMADILIDRCLYTKFTGPLAGIDPSISAGPHGPYYIMIDNATHAAEKKEGGPWPENDCYTLNCVEAIVVPNADQKTFLIAILDKAQEHGLIDATQYEEAVGKIKTYAELAE